MKKQVLFFLIALLITASCNQQQTFNINLDLANTEGKTVYLQSDGEVP